MSNPFRAIKKVFKKVAKVAKKVLPIALAVGAVVFTGGAALGVLPSFSAVAGGLVAKLGLSAGLSGALTGAITSAGFGAAIGGITGGKKGLQKGALMGALTGGALGAISPASFGIVKGAEGVTTMNALRNGGNAFAAAGKSGIEVVKGADGIYRAMDKSITTSIGSAPSTGPLSNAAVKAAAQPAGMPPNPIAAAAPVQAPNLISAAPVVGQGMAPAAAAAPAAAPASGGMLGFLEKNPMLSGQLLQGIGGALSGKDEQEGFEERAEYDERRASYLYGGIDRKDPFGVRSPALGDLSRPRYYYDREKRRVVDRQQEA